MIVWTSQSDPGVPRPGIKKREKADTEKRRQRLGLPFRPKEEASTKEVTRATFLIP